MSGAKKKGKCFRKDDTNKLSIFLPYKDPKLFFFISTIHISMLRDFKESKREGRTNIDLSEKFILFGGSSGVLRSGGGWVSIADIYIMNSFLECSLLSA